MIVLHRPDGSVVAAFNPMGADPEETAAEVWGDAAGGAQGRGADQSSLTPPCPDPSEAPAQAPSGHPRASGERRARLDQPMRSVRKEPPSR